jgi:hypothetical protein
MLISPDRFNFLVDTTVYGAPPEATCGRESVDE